MNLGAPSLRSKGGKARTQLGPGESAARFGLRSLGAATTPCTARFGAFQRPIDYGADGKRENVVRLFSVKTANILENHERLPANQNAQRRYQPVEFRTVQFFARRLKSALDPLNAPITAA